ncbi:MAG: dihydroneopterin aldolase [Dehalococcoidia bacterium]|nr:dihydroneopterin aldolase [Dehalococcoidia bacterium]
MDTISLKGMVFYGYHGALPEEQKLGQRFIVDLDVEADLQRAGVSDQLGHTINYSQLFHIAKEVMEGPPMHLLEAVGETIASKVLSGFPVTSVRVRVSKPSPPIKGAVLEAASVTLWRTKSSGSQERQ